MFFLVYLVLLFLMKNSPKVKLSSNSPIPIKNTSNLSRDEMESCLQRYKSKLEDYKVAIFDARYALEDAYGYPSPSYNKLLEIIDSVNEALDVDEMPVGC